MVVSYADILLSWVYRNMFATKKYNYWSHLHRKHCWYLCTSGLNSVCSWDWFLDDSQKGVIPTVDKMSLVITFLCVVDFVISMFHVSLKIWLGYCMYHQTYRKYVVRLCYMYVCKNDGKEWYMKCDTNNVCVTNKVCGGELLLVFNISMVDMVTCMHGSMH